MSGIAGLSSPIIDAILRNLDMTEVTRTELGNFLRGRKTTVTDTEEFGRGLRGVSQDIEAGGAVEEGGAIGEIVGALEGGLAVGVSGGLIVAKGAEIIEGLRDLMRGGRAENDAREHGRGRAGNQTIIRGAIGVGATTARALEEQLRGAARSAAKRGVVPEDRKSVE